MLNADDMVIGGLALSQENAPGLYRTVWQMVNSISKTMVIIAAGLFFSVHR